MRRFDYDKFTSEKKTKFFSLKAKLGYKRAARNKIRNIQERDTLMEMDKKRFESRIKSGEIEIINNRFFKMHLGT
ncbi:hypothetical protein KAW08_02540 [bacterium]|nr:hypothetical protein [bacterium]